MSFEKHLSKESLQERFQSKFQKSRALGTDGVSPELFAEILDSEIELIQRKVKNLSYRFSRFNEKLILKNKYSPPRAVYIPTVRDRLVLNAMNTYLGEQFLDDLKPYRMSVKANITDIIQTLEDEQFDAFIKLDVKNFFSSLDHEILIEKLQNRINDKTAFSLLKKVLHRSVNGIAQGLSISSKLAEIYLNDVDKNFKHRTNLKYFRFVDDILIICNDADVDTISSEIQQEMQDLKLSLHAAGISDKSSFGYLGKDTLEYLGFSFSNDKISVRESSVEKLRKRIRQVFAEYSKAPLLFEGDINMELYNVLNLKITGCLYNNKPYGWLFFFKDINDLTLLHHLDWFVKKCFDDFKEEYNPKEVKSFVKAYFTMKSLTPHRLNAESYIPSFDRELLTTQIPTGYFIDDLEDTPSTLHEKTKLKKYYNIERLEKLIFDLENDVEIY